MRREHRVGIAFLIGAIATLAVFWSIGSMFLDGYVLDLGVMDFINHQYAAFLLMYLPLGTLAVVLLGAALAHLAGERGAVLTGRVFGEGADRRWMMYGTAAGVILPVLVRILLLEGMPLADDEDAYRFQAQLLVTGRLVAESPPLKLFFDAPFMINDGKYYAQYFMGWPILMAPGVWLGITGFMNALYFGVTVVPLFLAARRLAGSAWAKVAVLLLLTSPMLLVAAATELSHTSCMAALAWLVWLVMRASDDDAPTWVHAAAATAFSLAFLVRPATALGLGAPLLAAWCWTSLRRGTGRGAAVVAFVVPAVVLSGIFFGINQIQNGNPLVASYTRGTEYAAENGHRFITNVMPENDQVKEFGTLDPSQILARGGVGLLRLNFALFGWPSSLALLLVVGFAGWRRWIWASLIAFAALHALARDAGIDTFGPVHYTEAALPVILLTAAGFSRLHGWIASADAPHETLRRAAVPSLAASLVVVAAVAYTPVRWGAIARIASALRVPYEQVADAGLAEAVVFTSRPFASRCAILPTRPQRVFHPLNDPDLRNSVLWANHLTVEEDRRLMEHFPGRSGYIQLWDLGCQLHLIPLDTADPAIIPRGNIGGTEEGLPP